MAYEESLNLVNQLKEENEILLQLLFDFGEIFFEIEDTGHFRKSSGLTDLDEIVDRINAQMG